MAVVEELKLICNPLNTARLHTKGCHTAQKQYFKAQNLQRKTINVERSCRVG